MRIHPALWAAVAVACSSPPPLDLSHWEPGPRSPLTGGTIVMGAEEQVAYASYTDLDAVARLDFASGRVDLLQLGQGTRPVRLTFDAQGVLHVVLRGTGEIADVDVSQGSLKLRSRRAACAEPRGIAADGDTLYVACSGGDVVTFFTTGGAWRSRTFMERDLRDVAVQNGQVIVSTFRSATLIRGDGGRQVLPSLVVPATEVSPAAQRTFTPSVAWSMAKANDGTLVVAYQRGLVEPVGPVGPAQTMCSTPSNTYGGVSGTEACPDVVSDCTQAILGISHSAIATVTPSGVTSYLVPGTEPIDVAVDPLSGEIAVLLAGSSEVVRVDTQTDDSQLFELVNGPRSACQVSGLRAFHRLSTAPQLAHALAYGPGGQLVVQTDTGAILQDVDGLQSRLDLDERLNAVLTRDDRGVQLFHTVAAPGGVACATCHPEAGEDGRVWSLPEGVRRTQSLAFGAASIAPFHWDGALGNFYDLMQEIFVKRMGGAPPGPGELTELSDWLAQRPAVKSDAPASAAGKALFVGKAGCAQCHAGERLSNGQRFDVGTGGAFKVPSLVGVSARFPLMHTGCAKSFAERFDPACGGDRHGNVSTLSAQELEDLTAYLSSL